TGPRPGFRGLGPYIRRPAGDGEGALQARGRAGRRDRPLAARGRLGRGGTGMSEPMQDGTGQDATSPATRSGFVALIGAPNAGKSTLVNQLVGTKVSIVTHKVQTTRAIVRGIATHGAAQIVFVDTPGIFRPRRRLDRAMVTT